MEGLSPQLPSCLTLCRGMEGAQLSLCHLVVVTHRGGILAGTRPGLRAAPACAVEEIGPGGYTHGEEEAMHLRPSHRCRTEGVHLSLLSPDVMR